MSTQTGRSPLDKYSIAYFDEIGDVFQLTFLYHLSLNWPVTPELLKEKRQNDDRYVPEFGVFAVTNDGTVIGGVFLMQIPTRTINGKLMVGGINAVATRPGYQRRGVMTALMARCHKYFSEHHLVYSFLTTSQSLGAHSLYQKLGYKDLLVREIAWKQAERTTLLDKKFEAKNFQEENYSDVNRIFREVTKGSHGFVFRPTDFLKARTNGPFPKPSPKENMIFVKHNDEISGYAYWESSPQFNICMEILAIDKSSFTSLLADAENRFHGKVLVINCSGLGRHEVDWLQSMHYTTGVQTYGTVMVKSVRGHTNLEKIRSLFGVDKGCFRMGLWDYT